MNNRATRRGFAAGAIGTGLLLGTGRAPALAQGKRDLRVGVWGGEFGNLSPVIRYDRWWSILSAGWLHGSLLHIAFNMYFVLFLGRLLEPALGKLRFGVLYFVALLGGSLGALLLDFNSPVVGASGAAFGMLAAGIIAMRARGMDPMQSGLGMTLVLNLGITFLIPGISIGGHIGGLVAGGIAGFLLFEVAERRQSLRTPALVATILLGVVIAVACILYSRAEIGL